MKYLFYCTICCLVFSLFLNGLYIKFEKKILTNISLVVAFVGLVTALVGCLLNALGE